METKIRVLRQNLSLEEYFKPKTNTMKDFIIKRFAYYYNVKLFGIKFSYLRAVLPIIFFFCIAGIYTSSQDYQSVWEFQTLDFLLWLPVLICLWFGFGWFGLGYFRLFPIKYKDLQDWEQKHQYLLAPEMVKKELIPKATKKKDLKRFKILYRLKYEDKDNNFVNAILGIAPFAIIFLTAIIFYIIY